MILVDSKDEIKTLYNNNKIIVVNEKDLTFSNTKIIFYGRDNILYCEGRTALENSKIVFQGNNSVIFLGDTPNKYLLNIKIFHDSIFYMGQNNYIDGTLNAIIAERKNCLIGNNCLFSFGIWIRTADAHLIYDCSSAQRINNSKSIYIGDHVWIGQDVKLWKGTEIDSGSIIGGGSVVANKKIPNNVIFAGNPAAEIGNHIFWDGSCTHGWNQNRIKNSQSYGAFIENHKIQTGTSSHIFRFEGNRSMSYGTLDKEIDACKTSRDKLNYLFHLVHYKNRFVHFKERKIEN